MCLFGLIIFMCLVLKHNSSELFCLDDVGSRQDHHAAIGQGKIGLECFKWIMNEPLFNNIPIILETPGAGHEAEIALLYQLCD